MKPRNDSPISRRDVMARIATGAASLPLLPSFAAGQDPRESRKTKLGIGYRSLGRTGFRISEIILGAGRVSRQNARIVEAALDQGITYLDTAQAYVGGQSEIAIGRVLARRKCRDKVILASKASRLRHAELRTQSDAEVEKAIRANLDDRLRNLRTDYLDVFFIQHGCRDPGVVSYPQMWKTIEKLKKEGKIRAVALSTHTRYDEVAAAVLDDGRYDVLMTIINAATTDPELTRQAAARSAENGGRRRRRRGFGGGVLDMRPTVASCKEKNVGLIAMKAANPLFFGGTWEASVEKHGKDLPMTDHQVLYTKALHEAVAGVNVGMSRMSYLDEAIYVGEELELRRKKAVRKG